MDKPKYFLYDFHVNQKDVIDFDLGIDFNSHAIYALFKHIVSSKAAMPMPYQGETYYKFTANFVLQQLPMLSINTKAGLLRHIKKLSECGLLKPYPFNQTEGIAFYTYGSAHYAIHDRNINPQELPKSVDNEPLPLSENETGVNKSLRGGKQKFTGGVNKSLHNNNTLTIDNFNNNNEERVPAFFSKKIDSDKDLPLPTNPPKKERKGRGTLETYLQFVKLSKDEHAQFTEKYGAKFVEDCIEKLDNWIDRQTGAAHEKYLKQNHAACFRAWVIKAVNEDMERAAKRTGSFNGSSNRITSSQAVNLD